MAQVWKQDSELLQVDIDACCLRYSPWGAQSHFDCRRTWEHKEFVPLWGFSVSTKYSAMKLLHERSLLSLSDLDKNLYHNVNLEEEKVEVNELKPNDPKQLRFEVHAFGEDLKLVLHRNAQLVTPQAQVIRRHNSRTVSWERVGDYYTGYIQSRTGSSVAVKVNNGSLVGESCILVLANEQKQAFKKRKILLPPNFQIQFFVKTTRGRVINYAGWRAASIIDELFLRLISF